MIIYLIKNCVNGKLYVGKTEQSIERRWLRHMYEARQGRDTRLYRAIRKYGKDAFSMEPLCCALSIEHLNALEIHFIAELKAMDRLVGYNMTPGGDGIQSGYKHSDATRAKSSESKKGKKNSGQFQKGQISRNKGKHIDPITRARISEKVSKTLVGNQRRKGIPHSDEVKARIAESMKASPNGAPELMAQRARKFWENVSAEDRRVFIAQREAKRQETLRLKREVALC